MALPSPHGPLAIEVGRARAAGVVFEGLADVTDAAALSLPFALIPGVNAPLVVLVVVAGVIGEIRRSRAIGQSATQLCRSVRQERSRPCLWPTRDPARPRPSTRIVDHALSCGPASSFGA